MLKQVDSPNARLDAAALHPLNASADELLRSLDLEIARSRAGRGKSEAQRAAILAGGLLLILGGTTVALCVLFSSFSGRAHERSAASAQDVAISEQVKTP